MTLPVVLASLAGIPALFAIWLLNGRPKREQAWQKAQRPSTIHPMPDGRNILEQIATQLFAKNPTGCEFWLERDPQLYQLIGSHYRQGAAVDWRIVLLQSQTSPRLYLGTNSHRILDLSDPDSLDKLANWFHGLGLKFEAPTLAKT